MEENNHQYYSLITGASAGLGKAFAIELAKRGRNLFLISLPGTGLEYLSPGLESQYGIKSRYLEVDLLQQGACIMIQQYAREKGITVDLLINNAGVGYNGEIGTYTEDKIREIIMLNILSATSLTNLFIDQLKSVEKSYILNISSFSAYIPLPYKSIYQASKAYVYYFSQSLCHELRKSPVHVSVVMPGTMPTNKKVMERIKNHGRSAEILLINPDQVAKESLDGLFDGEKVIIPGKMTKVVFGIGNWLPYIILRLICKNLFKGQT